MEVLRIKNISKQYKLGEIDRMSYFGDLKKTLKRLVGMSVSQFDNTEVNDRSVIGNSKYVWALNELSFSVNKGEVLGIVGRNGAGKSTLLKLLSRVTGPTTGTIQVKGRMASLLEVGTGFHPELTGKENIFLNGAILGMAKEEIEGKYDEIIAFSGVARYIDTPVKRYSSGMYVRLAFAIAVHLEPEILIIDEVLAVGDADFQKKCIKKMREIAQSGRTILFVSHNMSTVRELCSRAILLDKGGIVLDGDTEKVVQEYLTAGHSNSQFGLIPATYPRTIVNKDGLEIISLKLFNESGEDIDRFFYQEKITIKVKVKILKDIGAEYICLASFGDQIQDRISYHSSNNDLISETHPVLDRGEYEFELVTNQSLLPGSYHVNFSVLDTMGYPYDGVLGYGSFEISELGRNKNLKYTWSKSLGSVAFENEFKINLIK